jgi:signal peptidase I
MDTEGARPHLEDAEPHVAESQPRGRKRSALFEIAETLVLTVVIFLGVQTFVAQPYKVEQLSMENTLQPGQYVLVDKLTPRWNPYSRGEVVVFDPPPSWAAETNGVPLIKRVIGLPGDRIQLRNGQVYVNDVKLAEPYLYAVGGAPQSTDPSPDGQSEWLVPAGDLFVMGDHRQNSADSRTFGPIERGLVVGRAWLRYWPINTFGVIHKPSYAGLPPP